MAYRLAGADGESKRQNCTHMQLANCNSVHIKSETESTRRFQRTVAITRACVETNVGICQNMLMSVNHLDGPKIVRIAEIVPNTVNAMARIAKVKARGSSSLE